MTLHHTLLKSNKTNESAAAFSPAPTTPRLNLLWDPASLQSDGYRHIFFRRCRRIFSVHLHFCDGNNSNEIFRVSVIHDSGDSDCVIRTCKLEWGHQRLEVCGLYLKNFYSQHGGRAFHRNGGRYTWLQYGLPSGAEEIWCIAFRWNRSLALD